MRILKPLLFLLPLLYSMPLHAFDADDDGIPNKYDECPKDPEDMDGFQDQDGCPDVDNDKDGICDAWVAEKGQSEKYASVCHGSDKCTEIAEDKDGFEDEDGCPDLDNDKDGIPDLKDKCPNDAEDIDGFEDNDGCPDVDNDKDGICDAWVAEKGQSEKYASVCQATDKCPNAAEDKDGFEDADGCPDPDNDKDGIPDNMDKCPNEAENMNGVDDDDGCVDHVTAPLQATQSYAAVKFRTGTDELTVESEQSLDMLSKQLLEYGDKQIEIHVSMTLRGKKKEEYVKLLQDRSKALVAYLVEKGVKAERVKEIPYTLEALEANKGLENDFNQDKPVEVRLLNP